MSQTARRDVIRSFTLVAKDWGTWGTTHVTCGDALWVRHVPPRTVLVLDAFGNELLMASWPCRARHIG